jgi:endonuclease/exonuclease/phosphatase family metal-dependent hydrolase
VELITWNVQWFRGLDGRVDPARVVAHARSLADFDVLCVQEVADHFPHPLLAGNDDADQFAALARLLPGYTIVPGIGANHPGANGRRRRFGNVIATRWPVGPVRIHALPWPADAAVPSMPRVAVEAIVEAPFGPVRIVTTHLEYWSQRQRDAQVLALREIHREAHGRAVAGKPPRDDDGPFRAHATPRATIVAGDFNMGSTDPGYVRMLDAFDDGTSRFHDAWTLVHGAAPQPPTFNLHERFRPDSAPVACDFVFVSDEVAARVRDVRVDGETRLSDHQPVVVTLEG